MFTSLADAIRHYRNKTGRAQDVVASILDIPREKLSRWEHGAGKQPTEEEAEGIARALQLSHTDRATLLMCGDFLPSETDIAFVLSKIQGSIDEWPHPSYLIDYSWRVLSANAAAIEAYGTPEDQASEILRLRPNLLEFEFDPSLPVVDRLSRMENFRDFQIREVARFKSDHRYRLDPPHRRPLWIQALIDRLLRLPDFEEAWRIGTPEMVELEYRSITAYQLFDNRFETLLDFVLFAHQPRIDPRFETIFYVPREALRVDLSAKMGVFAGARRR